MPEQSSGIAVGIRHSLQLRVDERLAVPALADAFAGFRGMPPVFATAFMVAFIEWACIEALHDRLGPDKKTVGTHIDVSHVAATPIGMTATAEVELIAAEDRSLRFRMRSSDQAGLIGEGFHERAIIDQAKFLKRVVAKAGRSDV